MSQEMTRDESIRKLGEMIHGINFAMMTTLEEDGKTMRSRPMATQRTDFDGDLWFFTRVGTPKAQEIAKDRHVCLSYSDPEESCFVSVSGIAEVVKDQAKAKELWNPAYRAWFPDGLDDP